MKDRSRKHGQRLGETDEQTDERLAAEALARDVEELSLTLLQALRDNLELKISIDSSFGDRGYCTFAIYYGGERITSDAINL